MSLVGDVISHVALPGIALGLIFNFNPFLGAFTALFLSIVGIWFLEIKTELPSETLVGIFFALSLALGLLLTPEQELLEVLFGDITRVGPTEVLIALILVSSLFIIMSLIHRGLTLSIISKQLAQSVGINISRTSFIFLVLIAIIVALGLNVTGVFLTGALVILPAAAAKNISISLANFTKSSAIFGGLSAFGGIVLGNYLGFHPGPIVVLTGGFIFLITLFFKK